MAPLVVTKKQQGSISSLVGGNSAAINRGNWFPGNHAEFSMGVSGDRLLVVSHPGEITKNIERFMVVKPGIHAFRVESAGHSLESPDGFPIGLTEIYKSPKTTIKPPVGAFGPEVGDREFWPSQNPI